MNQLRLLIVCGLVLSACGGGTPVPDPVEPGEDAGAVVDSGTSTEGDAGETDAGEEVDSGTPPSSPVRINEVYVDRDLSGDRVEYVELAGPVGEPLGALSLRLLGPDGGVRQDVRVTRSDAGIGETGTWVVGGAFASGRVDESYNVASWGLENTSGAVQLVKDGTEPELIDVLGYGASVPPPPTPPFATAEGMFVTLPSDVDVSVGRRAGAADTNDNAADFCSQASTGGATNGECL